MDISGIARDCALPLAHLVLPAITWLCLTASSDNSDRGDVLKLLPYIARHAHGPQEVQPLQYMLISGERTRTRTHIFVWPVPADGDVVFDANANASVNVDVDDDTSTLHATRYTARLVLSVDNKDWVHHDTYIDAAMATLPLNSLVIFTASNRGFDEQFWLRAAPRWSLLQRVRLGALAARGFIKMLLRDKEWRECPLLPSLTRLDLIEGTDLSADKRISRLCDALMKRVEQGVPLETLDLRTCVATNDAVRLLCEIVVDVLAPAWPSFVSPDNSGVEDYSDSDSDSYSNASDNDEEGEEEENYSEIES